MTDAGLRLNGTAVICVVASGSDAALSVAILYHLETAKEC